MELFALEVAAGRTFRSIAPKRLSPVAWQHINLVGKYEFCHNQKAVDFQRITEMLLAGQKINLSGKS